MSALPVVPLGPRTSESVSASAIPGALVRDLLSVVLLTGRRRSARSRLEDELGSELLAALDGQLCDLGARDRT
jgi:hypothetical protein